MTELRLGMMLWGQSVDWSAMLDAGQRADRLGYEHLWTCDHLLASWGDPAQPIFEGWMAVAAWAAVTSRVRLGLLTGANTFRNPGLVAKLATTLDHISGGRAILGLGSGWFELEHLAHGIEFGRSFGERLDWLDEAVGIISALLASEEVTRRGARYQVERLRHAPRPVQEHLPILIGGVGERKTLRTVAHYADMWNAIGTAETLRRKDEILRAHCAALGRDEREIERTVDLKVVIRDDPAEARRVWDRLMRANKVDRFGEIPLIGSPDQVAEGIDTYRQIGFHTVIVEFAAPYDVESIERLIGEIRPMLQGAA